MTPVHFGLFLFPVFLCNLQPARESFKHGGGGIHGPGIQAGGSSGTWVVFAVQHSSPGLAPASSQGWTVDLCSTGRAGGCSWGGQGRGFQQQQSLARFFVLVSGLGVQRRKPSTVVRQPKSEPQCWGFTVMVIFGLDYIGAERQAPSHSWHF